MKCTLPTLGGWKTFSEPTYPKELEKEGPHQYLNPGFWTSQQKGGPRLCPGLLPCSRSPLVLGLPANFSLSLFLGLPCTWPKKSALLLIVFLIGFVNLASQFLFFFFFFAALHGLRVILVPPPGIEPAPRAVEAQSPKRWITGKAP